ncbi:MAG: (p)ppGpp synthetase, partial [Chloroflexota bacterium]
MTSDLLSVILSEYDLKVSLYTKFTDEVKKLVTTLLEEAHIRYSNVEARTKEKKRLKDKIIKSEDKYSKLSDITDLSGIRIITFFTDDVD